MLKMSILMQPAPPPCYRITTTTTSITATTTTIAKTWPHSTTMNTTKTLEFDLYFCFQFTLFCCEISCVTFYVFLVSNFSAGNGAGGKKDKYEVWQCTVCEVTPVISALGWVTRPIQWSVNKAIKSVEWWGWLDQGTNCASYAAAAHEPKLWCPTLGSFFNSSK